MATVIGTNTWKVILCSAITASGADYVPDTGAGEYVFYIKCQQVLIDKGYDVTVNKNNYGQNWLKPDKRKCQKISIDGILKNLTTNVENAVKWIDDCHKDSAEIYAFVYYPNSAAAGTYYAFQFTDSSFAHQDYLKCVVTSCKYILKAGGVYDVQIEVEEVM